MHIGPRQRFTGPGVRVGRAWGLRLGVCELTQECRFGCAGGMSMGGYTGEELRIGPLVVRWIAPWFESWSERVVRVGLRLASALVVIGLVVIAIRRAKEMFLRLEPNSGER